MSLRYSLFGCLLCCWACKNIEDAKPAERNTFIKFYEAPHNLYGVAAETVPDGYIIVGNETLANGNQNSILIRTDKKGDRLASDVILPNGYSKALKVATDGYYIIGDSIKSNLQSSNVDVTDLLVYSARLFKISLNGDIVKSLVIADHKNTSKITDIHGGAITVDNVGNLIVLGTFKTAQTNSTEKPYVVSLDPTTLDTVWAKTYDIIDRDYINSKSVHSTISGDLIWASNLLKDNQNFSQSYLSVPYVKEGSVFINNDLFGETTEQRLSVSDIQPTAGEYGYGIIGTYASTDGSGANMFFIKIDQNGNIIPGSDRYFDGEKLGTSSLPVDATVSASEDTGDAIVSTNDNGFMLAGSMLTTPNRGNGGQDILLVKIDSQGNVQWSKIIGGTGDETVSSIQKTDDGGFLICGSNNLSGLSSLFVMKIDKNGDLND